MPTSSSSRRLIDGAAAGLAAVGVAASIASIAVVLVWLVRMGSGAPALDDEEAGGRGLAVLAAVTFVLGLLPAWRIGRTLVARFDRDVLRPPLPAAAQAASPRDPPAVDAARQAALDAWCLAGLGDGRAAWWRPWSLPTVSERLSIAILPVPDRDAVRPLVDAFARRLDRDDELAMLAARSRRAGWRLKLAVKWHELRWWRARHAQQPWDCGHLLDDPAVPARLARFQPRRPTLIVTDDRSNERLHSVVAALRAAQNRFRHPVRLLVVATALSPDEAARLGADQTIEVSAPAAPASGRAA